MKIKMKEIRPMGCEALAPTWIRKWYYFMSCENDHVIINFDSGQETVVDVPPASFVKRCEFLLRQDAKN